MEGEGKKSEAFAKCSVGVAKTDWAAERVWGGRKSTEGGRGGWMGPEGGWSPDGNWNWMDD